MKTQHLPNFYKAKVEEVQIGTSSYKDAHALCELAGRPKNQPWNLSSVMRVAEDLGIRFKRINVPKISAGVFARENPVGKFYVVMAGHAFAIVDGVIMNTHNDRVFLRAVFKYED